MCSNSLRSRHSTVQLSCTMDLQPENNNPTPISKKIECTVFRTHDDIAENKMVKDDDLSKMHNVQFAM